MQLYRFASTQAALPKILKKPTGLGGKTSRIIPSAYVRFDLCFAGKILLGLPKQEILQDIRSSLTSMENVERVHLTTWKDLSNMSQSLAVDRRSASDWISADFLVQELERQENVGKI